MQIDRRPYWFRALDRWKLLIAFLLLLAFLIADLRGCGAPQTPSLTPTITQPAPGAILDYAAPGAIVGRTAPGAFVHIYDGDTLLGSTKADEAGFYRYSLPNLAPGPHSLIVRVYDADGNLLASSEPVSVTVSGGPAVQASPTAQATAAPTGPSAGLPPTTGTPALTGTPGVQPTASVAVTATVPGAAPQATAQATAVAPAFTGLQEGAQLLAGVPGLLTGIAAPGTKVQILDGEKVIGETTADAEGKWSLSLPALSAGIHALIVRAIGPDGAVLATSAPVHVTVVAGPATTKPSATAAVTVTTTAGPTVAAATAAVTVTTAAPAGATAVPTTGTSVVTATVAPTAMTAPTATVTTTATVPATATTVATGPTPAGATAVPTVKPDVIVPAGSPVQLTGTAQPGTVLRIFDGSTLLGEVIADAAGQWSLLVPQLSAGLHSLTARVFDAAGKLISSSAPLTVLVLPEATATVGPGTPAAAAATGTPVLPAATPSAGATLVSTPQIIAPQAGAVITSTSPGVLEGTAPPGSTVRVYDGNKLVAELQVGPDGRWRVVLPMLEAGIHQFTARILAPDGSEVSSAPLVVTVQSEAEAAATATAAATAAVAAAATPLVAAPVGATPSAGALATSVPSAAQAQATRAATRVPTPRALAARAAVSSPKSGATVGFTQPLLTGTSIPGLVVRIYEGNTLLGETVADSKGRWYFVPPFPLGAGRHLLHVATLMPDGTEAIGDLIEIIVGEQAPALKALTFLPSFGKAPSQVGILQGTAPPGTIVRIYDDSMLLGRVETDASGNWQFGLSLHTKPGPHEYSIVAVTPEGVVVYRTAPVEVIIK